MGITLMWILLVCFTHAMASEFQIGQGISDITGPAAEVVMMGYAQSTQITSGIHLRQYSRAFIIGDHKSRVVYVNVDACMVSTALKVEVVKKLKTKFGSLYTDANVLLSGIHTHSGPGGFHQYVLLDITSYGFVPQALQALVDGIVQSIENAHNNYQPGDIMMNAGELLDASINRSPTAYLNNPAQERARYAYNTDKEMTLLKFVDQNNKGLGALSWFAVHCTSMNFTNTLISGDNKGYAAQLFEKEANGSPSFPGQGHFVAAFGQSNEGDVSPNTRGPHCTDTGLPCDAASSTCGGKSGKCIASGPGKDMADSTRIIGEKQYQAAKGLYDGAASKLSGRVQYRHQWVDMSAQTFPINSTHKVSTCKPAMGYSFAAGTTDGPTNLNFKQGAIKGNAFWDFVSHALSKPSKAEADCQAPKPILLNTGAMTFPYQWQPTIAPVQILQVGQLIILAVPGEFTTMAGRRLREEVKKVLVSNGYPTDITVVVAGLSNSYVDYITTFEEYQIQRYEGASTIYGPHTLDAFIYQFTNMARAMAQGKPVKSSVSPPDLLSKQISFQTGVVLDSPPIFKKFGDVLKDVRSGGYAAGDTVAVEFVSGHPKNNLRHGSSFLAVQMKTSTGKFVDVFLDSDWSTKYEWKRTNGLFGHSKATISWTIPAGTQSGTYRLQHCGDTKSAFGKVSSFCGVSGEFTVTKS